jgi:hypothetical protein
MSGKIMSLSEAELLVQMAKEVYPNRRPQIRRLAGHEWVVRFGSSGKYIWNMEDWREKFAPSEKVGIEA